MLDIKFKLMPGHTSKRVWMSPSPLKALFWNTTYACNFNCEICFTDSGRSSSGELTTQEAMELSKKAYAAGVENIIISGGEPFIRKDITEILAYMAKQGISTRIASNGSILTYEILKRLRDETLTKSFQISLDTLDPDLYSELHGVSPGILEKVLNVLGTIKKLGFHTTVSSRLTPRTLPCIPELLDRAYNEGWATVTIHFPLLTGRGINAFPQDTDFLSLLGPAIEHFLGLPSHWLVEIYIPWAQYHPISKSLKNRLRVDYVGCRAGRDRLTINPCGDISFCVCLDEPKLYMGNIRRDKLGDIFRNSGLCDMVRNPAKHEICNDCSNVMRCGGGCRVAAYVLSGRIDGQDELCPVYKASFHR